jgi:probable F420-dependent oxidoreductase
MVNESPHLGVVFPTMEIGNDPDEIRRFAIEVEGLGFDHLMTFDHVVGADPAVHGPLEGPYTHEHPFHEPFVLFGFLAAVCRLEFFTGILVLPQRQAALVAKQAAEVDVLSRGRLRLGVGIGWNRVEYEALGVPFQRRGARLAEQIAVMRALWSGEVIDFTGEDHRVRAASMLPRPVRGTVPIWIGCGRTPSALTRVGRFADGWVPLPMRPESFDRALEFVREAARQAGRDPAAIGLHGQVRDCRSDELSRIAAEVEQWRERGATHISFDTLWQGLPTVDAHLEVLATIGTAIGLNPPS